MATPIAKAGGGGRRDPSDPNYGTPGLEGPVGVPGTRARRPRGGGVNSVWHSAMNVAKDRRPNAEWKFRFNNLKPAAESQSEYERT